MISTTQCDVLRCRRFDGRRSVVGRHEALSVFGLNISRLNLRILVHGNEEVIRADDELHGADHGAVGSHDDALEKIVVVDLDSVSALARCMMGYCSPRRCASYRRR